MTFTQDGQVQTTAQQNDRGRAEIDLTQLNPEKQMLKLKLSNIVERDLYIDSDSFKSLSPKMKDAVKEIFESIKDNTDDIINTLMRR